MIETQEMNCKTLIEKVREHGDLVILGQEGTCKTTLLENIAREFQKNDGN